MAAGVTTNDQKIEHMYETVLDHAGNWARARTTHLVCKIEGDDVPIVKTNLPRRNGDVHAEKLLIDDLESNDTVNETNGSSDSEPDLSEDLKKMSLDESNKKSKDKKAKGLELLNITVYINNSPCSDEDHDCTGKLIRFLDRYRRIKLNLYVTSLYNIRRVTCRNEPHYDAVNDGVHRTNYAGLRTLMHHERCGIRAFTEDVWGDLLGIANVSQAVRGQLMDRYGTITAGNDRSRMEEDKRIQNDLDYIFNTPLP